MKKADLSLAAPLALLAALGRQGPRALSAIVAIGILVPPFGAAFKPFLTAAVFGLLCISFVRLDTRAFLGYLRKPGLVLLATVWSTLLVPLLFGVLCLAFGIRQRWPELYLGLTLQGIAPPMMSAPAIAALLGLDATLVLASMIASTALIPITAPLLAYLLIGPDMALAPLAIGVKLLAVLTGSAAVGLGLRCVVPSGSVERHADAIGGLNILILFVIVAALMETVAAQLTAAPLTLVAYAVLAFAVFAALLYGTTLLFIRAGHPRAMAIGLMVAQRNLGLMISATGNALPSLTWLYFAVCQFPIYLSPKLLQTVIRRHPAFPAPDAASARSDAQA